MLHVVSIAWWISDIFKITRKSKLFEDYRKYLNYLSFRRKWKL